MLLAVLALALRHLRLAGVAFWLTACGGLPWQIPEVSAADADAATSAESPTFSRSQLLSAWNELRGDAYPLDGFERWLEPGQQLTCDRTGMRSYRGTGIRYAGSVLVAPAFIDRLMRFEQVAAAAAREVYGREPRLVRHYGAFSCRPTRNRKHVVSEHALGNALDLVGFDFGPATKVAPLPDGAPKQLKWAFQVRVARHWRPSRPDDAAAALHARFLALLTDRLRARGDIFRSMYGPGHGGHDDHLHLDAAPWRYIDL